MFDWVWNLLWLPIYPFVFVAQSFLGLINWVVRTLLFAGLVWSLALVGFGLIAAAVAILFPRTRVLAQKLTVTAGGYLWLAFRQFQKQEERQATEFRLRVRQYRASLPSDSDSVGRQSHGSLASTVSQVSLSTRVPQALLPPALKGWSGWLLRTGKRFRYLPLVPAQFERVAFVFRFIAFCYDEYIAPTSSVQSLTSSGLDLLDEADGDAADDGSSGAFDSAPLEGGPDEIDPASLNPSHSAASRRGREGPIDDSLLPLGSSSRSNGKQRPAAT